MKYTKQPDSADAMAWVHKGLCLGCMTGHEAFMTWQHFCNTMTNTTLLVSGKCYTTPLIWTVAISKSTEHTCLGTNLTDKMVGNALTLSTVIKCKNQ